MENTDIGNIDEKLENLHLITMELSREIMKKIKKHFNKTNLSAVKYSVLKAVENNQDKILFSQLKNEARLKRANLSRVVEKLVKLGLLKRVNDKSDRRKVWVSITRKGKTTLSTFKNKEKEFIESIYKKINPEDIDLIIKALNKLKEIIID